MTNSSTDLNETKRRLEDLISKFSDTTSKPLSKPVPAARRVTVSDDLEDAKGRVDRMLQEFSSGPSGLARLVSNNVRRSTSGSIPRMSSIPRTLSIPRTSSIITVERQRRRESALLAASDPLTLFNLETGLPTQHLRLNEIPDQAIPAGRLKRQREDIINNDYVKEAYKSLSVGGEIAKGSNAPRDDLPEAKRIKTNASSVVSV